MQSLDIIEVSNEPPSFNKDEWIGKGQKYPKGEHVPLALKYYIDSLLVIPDIAKEEYIPSSNLAIKDFIKKKLPKISHSLPTVKAEISFLKEAPNVGTIALSTRELPPLPWLNRLKENFKQVALDGKKSIVDPQYPGSRVPLWWIGFWTELHNIHKIQQDWMKAMEWVEERTEGAQKKEQEMRLWKQAKDILNQLRWNEHTNIPDADGVSTSTFKFASYLSDNKMMDTDHINMMFAHLSERAEEDPATDSFVVIEQLRFLKAIEKVACAKGKDDRCHKSERWLGWLKQKISDRDVQAIILPVYLPDHKHWVMIQIDFEEEEIVYGDSLAHEGMPPPTDILKYIQLWLKKCFGGTYKNTGNSLSHGDQDNFTDCGILATNTATHDIFGDSLWNPNTKCLHRGHWFIKLSKAHIEYVNKSEKYTPYQPIKSCPQFLSHLLNPAPDSENVSPSNDNFVPMVDPVSKIIKNETLPGESHLQSLSHLLNPAPDSSSPVGLVQAFEDVSPSDNFELVVGPVGEGEVTVSAMIVIAQPIVPKKPNLKGGSSGGEKKKRTSPIDNEDMLPRKGPKLDQGDFVQSTERDLKFCNKILKIDPNSTIIDPKTVRHFKCGKELKMKEPYNTGNFKNHIEMCKGTPKSHKLPAGRMKTIDTFFAKAAPSSNLKSTTPISNTTFPCSGLHEASYPLIEAYLERTLERTGAQGGGGPSISSLAAEFFGKKY
ncbi:hypothetical protein BYT27DRAFT_7250099 [Phlegmacium glaucopus]|nr:hypothetical protein BYT27DRAFT_7250099 [Phlegmacium glaucopus]